MDGEPIPPKLKNLESVLSISQITSSLLEKKESEVACEACPQHSSRPLVIKDADTVIALAGNANVGKSVIFNQLTGVDQIIGNWPGKTVERAVGLLQHKGRRIEIVDLPGIYSFSTYSMEELVSRDFIALERPDAVINVIDANALERNLFFTIQLMEFGVPMVIALNQTDLLQKRGMIIDAAKLERRIGLPVISMIAIKGKGISELTEKVLEVADKKPKPPLARYGKEIEERIDETPPIAPKYHDRVSGEMGSHQALGKGPGILGAGMQKRISRLSQSPTD